MGASRWSFGSVAFDERAMRLFVHGRPVQLELKPLEVLAHLFEHAGAAVSKDDLVKAIWPGRVISDSALTSTIAKLREALGDDAESIQTVHGFGYRLQADVRKDDGAAPAESAAPVSARPSRHLAAIMFTDLVGYSALAHRDEKLAIELLELHRTWIREILPLHAGVEIETVGDAFLIEFAGALAAVECALALQRRFADHNRTAPEARRMQLRIGIHLGDVEHKDGKVMGDGVNIASRIHGMAEPGGICLSETVHHVVRNRADLHFRSLGSPALKNIATKLELFAVAVQAAPTRYRTPGARRWVPALVGGGLVATVAAALLVWFAQSRPADTARLSVAVLPFENLSAEPDSAYFTDGLHDTVIGHLARIKDLKVISRTSVMGYRGKHGNLREIARELGVAHILEGSVQRAGGRLRVAAQLIDTSDDTHVWSNEYDRQLADVFAVQADIAQQVAAAVHARLTPSVAAEIQRVPTQNQAAYDLYLRALVSSREVAHFDPVLIEQAIGWLEQAVALDPGFALAYVHLAFLHDDMYWLGFDPSEARRARLQRAVEKALELAPNLAAAHVAKALELYHGPRRYAEAIRELEIARNLEPGNSYTLYVLGFIHLRQNRRDEAVAAMEQGAALDPLNAKTLGDYGWALEVLRRYADADHVYSRIQALGADRGSVAYSRANLRFLQTGDLAQISELAENAPAGFDPGCGPSFARFYTRWLQRKFREAAAAAQACQAGYFGLDAGERVPTAFFAAIAHAKAGDAAAARKHAELARTDLVRQLQADPRLALTRMALALVHALLGDRQAAMAEGQRALADMPASRDALTHSALLVAASQLYSLLGDADRTLGALEQSLALPGGFAAHQLRIDPFYDFLREDPRFQKLIADNLPKPQV
jgi:adenylate cyclase